MLKKIRIVFLYRGLCFWLNNHSFYKECLWDGNFDIWVVPEANYIEPEILSMLKKDRVKIIEKNIKDNKYFDLRRLNPDYVLISTPYQEQRNKIYSAEYLRKYTKVIYIPYGIGPQKNLGEKYFKLPFFNLCYKIFCEFEFKRKLFLKFIDKNIPITSGYPPYDLLLNTKYMKDFNKKKNIWNFNDNNHIKVLWTPHWTVKKWGYISDDNKDKLGNSDFVQYADLWLKIPKLYPQLDIVMRPHPNLFKFLKEETNGEWTQEKIDKWKKDFESNSNVKIDNDTDYITQFLTSDCIINSSQSFFLVYLAVNKPFLLTSRTDVYDDVGNRVLNAYYKASNENDILNFIEEILIKKTDPLKYKREEIFKKEIFIPKGGCGLFIKNYILNDFINTNKQKINISQIFKNKYNK